MNFQTKIVTFLLLLSIPVQSFAACDFAKDIKSNEDGTYTYTKDCHIEVGKRVKRLVLVEEQVVELEKMPLRVRCGWDAQAGFWGKRLLPLSVFLKVIF